MEGIKKIIKKQMKTETRLKNILNRTADYTGDLNTTYYVVEQGSSVYYYPVFFNNFCLEANKGGIDDII